MHRVLLVEDAAPRSATEMMLERRLGRGWPGSGAGLIVAIDTAHTMEEALAFLHAQPDALVIDVDAMLTGEIAHLVRAVRSLPKMAYVLLTGSSGDNSLAAMAMLVDANDWLVRPFSVEHIAGRVAEWFRKMK